MGLKTTLRPKSTTLPEGSTEVGGRGFQIMTDIGCGTRSAGKKSETDKDDDRELRSFPTSQEMMTTERWP